MNGTKTYSKLEEDSKDVKPLVDEICNAPIDQLASVLEANLDWNRPPGDLLHWTKVLNTIDSVFETKNAEYGLDKDGPRPTSVKPEDSRLLQACLSFTATLLQNCRTRSLYSSQERIYQLCACGDADVLLKAMEIAMQLSHRYLRSSLIKKNPPPKQVKLHYLEMAKFYPPPMPTSFILKSLQLSASSGSTSSSVLLSNHKYEHYSLSDSIDKSKKYPSKWKSLNFQYYATISHKSAEKISKKNDKKMSANFQEGILTIAVPEDKVASMSLQQLYDLAASHDLPQECNTLFLFACLNAKAFNSKLADSMQLRSKLLQIKCMAFSAICCFCNTDFTSTNLFEVEAYTFGFMVDLISPLNTHLPEGIFNTAANCLEIISLKRVWGTEIVRLMGGNVRHGLLYQLMNHISKLVREDSESVNEVGFLSFFELIANLVDTKVITTRFAAGGLLQDLIYFLGIKTEKRRLSSMVANILINFLENSTENASLFADSDGFKVLVDVVEAEVESAIYSPELKNGPPEKYTGESKAAISQLEFLGNVLNILFALVESDLGDRLQNLLDSSLLNTFNRILTHARNLGEFVVSSTLNVIYKILHNEPTAFSIFNESGVIDSIINHYEQFFGPTFSWPTILVDILGAISLNNDGIQKVLKGDLIYKFFKTFLNFDSARALICDDILNSLAASFEELARHFPVFQPVILEALKKVALQLPQIASLELEAIRFYSSSSADNCYSNQSQQVEFDCEGNSEIDAWNLQKGSVLIDGFLIFCSNLIQESKKWATKISQAIPYNVWEPYFTLPATIDFSVSSAYSSLKIITRYTNNANKLEPLVNATFRCVDLDLIQKFINHPNDEYFLSSIALNPDEATEFMRQFNQLHSFIHMLSFVVGEHFDADTTQIQMLLLKFENDSNLLSNLMKLLTKCISEQAHLLTLTPIDVLAETSTFLLRPDILGLSALYKTKSASKKITIAKTKNTYQYRCLTNLVGTSCLLVITALCKLALHPKIEGLSSAQASFLVALHKNAIEKFNSMISFSSRLQTESRFFYTRSVVKSIILVCTSQETGDQSLNIPSLLIISEKPEIIDMLVDSAIDTFQEFERIGCKQLQSSIDSSDLIILLKIDYFVELLGFLTRLMCEDDIVPLPTLATLFNAAYCDDDEFLKEGFLTVNADLIMRFISTSIGSKSRMYQKDDYSLFSALPSKVTSVFFDLLHVAWAVTPTDVYFPIKERWMGTSLEELEYLMLQIKLDAKESEEFLKSVGSLLLVSSSTQSSIGKKVITQSVSNFINYEPIEIQAGKSLRNSREAEDEPVFDLAFVKIACLLKTSEFHFMETVGLLDFGGRMMRDLSNEIRKCKIDDIIAFPERIGNMVHLFQQIVFLVTLNTLAESHEKQPYFEEFVPYFVEILKNNPRLVDTPFCSAVLKFVTPFISHNPPCVLPGVNPQFPNLNFPSDLRDRFCDAILELEPKDNTDSVIALCGLLYLLSKDDSIKNRVLESRCFKFIMSQLDSYFQSCPFQLFKPLQDGVIQLIRINYESLSYVEGMMITSLRQLFKAHYSSPQELQSILEESGFVIGRNPQQYVDVATKYLRLDGCLSKEHTGTKVYLLDPSSSTNDDTDNMEDINETPIKTPKKIGLVSFILNHIMQVSREDWFSTPLEPEAIKGTKDVIEPKARAFANLAKNRKFRLICFLLQVLCELLGSYMEAKLEFITFSKKEKNDSDNKPRSTSLNFFIHQLISNPDLRSSNSKDEQESQRKTTINSLAKLAIFSLTSTPELNKPSDTDQLEDPDLAIVRKLTADLISKTFRDSIPVGKFTADSHSKLLGLFSLCSSLLSTKHHEVFLSLFNENATKMDNFFFASALLDAQIPSQISSVLANLDLNYPDVKKVSGAGLRVMTALAKIKLANANLLESSTSADKDDDDIGDVEDKDDTPDLFRNSTLGLYDIDVDSDEHDEYYNEASFNAISGSDISEDNDDDNNDGSDGIEDMSDYEMEGSIEGEEVFEDDVEGEFEGFDSDNSDNDIDIIEDLDIQSGSESNLGEYESDEFDESEGEFDFEVGEGGAFEDDAELDEEDAEEEDVDWDGWISAFGDSLGPPVPGHTGHNLDQSFESDLEAGEFEANSRIQPNALARALMNTFLDEMRPGRNQNVEASDNEDDLMLPLYLPTNDRSNPLMRLANLRSLLSSVPGTAFDETKSFIHLRSTSERWRSMFLIYQKMYSSKLNRAVKQSIIENIMDESIRLSKQRAEQKELAKKERLKKIEEKKNENKGNEEPPTEDSADISLPENQVNSGDAAPDDPHAPVEHIPIFVLIGDREVDIGGTDIDPEFFEALPEDMREEVFTQHVRERRANAANDIDVREIDPDFLDALPPNIRADIINQERMARVAGEHFDFGHEDDDTETLESDEWSDEMPPASEKPKKEVTKRKTFNVPLIDRAGVASLVRILFVPVPINQREGVYRSLVLVCHNKQTRIETVSMLLAILADGLRSQRSLQRAYKHICIRSKGSLKEVSDKTLYPLPMNATPITIGIQVLEAVLNLLENISPLRVFMLTEHENVYLSKKRVKHQPSPSNAKEDRFPINLLLKLLESPVLSEEYFFVDLLASVVHYATIPLLVLKDSAGKQIPSLFKTKFIPDSNLRLITKILSSGECLNSTFKRTMSSIQHLSMICDSEMILTLELSENASALGAEVVKELKVVTDELIMNPSDHALNNKLTAEFTALSSNQAKLLRVLTALDYMFNTHQKIADESHLRGLYNHLKLGPLWEALSECLTLLESNPQVSSNATALLPLIEALMVVCKHSKVKDIQIKEMMKFQNKKIDFSNEPIERLFFSFTEEHKKILNQMVRANPNLMSGPFSMLVRNPKVLEFDNKRNYFDRQLHDTKDIPHKMAFTVRREQVFLDSYRSLFFKSSEEFKKSQLEITFKGEQGVDGGGLTREWYQVLSRQMFNPDYALFSPVSSDENTYHPNRTSYVNPEHLSFFKFIGRVIGKSIFDRCLLDCHFSRAVYKKILDRSLSLKDMETLDLDYFKSLMWMLENDITDIITEDFSVESDDYGEHKIIDLIPDGRNISVTEENKHEYVQKIVEYRLQTSVDEQMSNFIMGFHEIIPKDLVAIFDEQELELLISGLPDIDIQDWQNNTIYQNYSASSEQIQWFWRAVRSFDNEERAKLLQFATGTSKVPLNGFKDLKGANNVNKFNIHRDYGKTDRLPSSHTCFNQIDLPVYESYETLRGSLLLAITEGYEGFQIA